MKIKTMAMAVLTVCIALTSCDDATETIGSSLTDNMDHLQISTDTFTVTTRSIIADSVLSRSNIGYVGKVKDPETGTYITGDFMAQFSTLEDIAHSLFPSKDSIRSIVDGKIIADSCELRLFYTSFFGDSLATMSLTAHEMAKPMQENVNYYSNFNPIQQGFIRTDGIQKHKTYTLTDLSVSEDTRYSSDYTPNIRIQLNEPYTDKDGKEYSNYGTYIMQKYYENPESFKNSYSFIHDICPGFYFKNESGLGCMAYVNISQLNVYFRYAPNDTTISNGVVSFPGTEEVLQTTYIDNDKTKLKQLAEDNTCTYIKSPAGIFTEMTLPVEEIMSKHPNDTLNTAKIVLTRINNEQHSDYSLDLPSYLLMVQKDSLYSFFENGKLNDNKTSFVTTRDKITGTTSTRYLNTYTFHNISNLVRFMSEQKEKGGNNYTQTHPNWNKVVIVPVKVSTATVNGSTVVNAINNDMSLISTRLVGGENNPNEQVKISVIYSKFDK